MIKLPLIFTSSDASYQPQDSRFGDAGFYIGVMDDYFGLGQSWAVLRNENSSTVVMHDWLKDVPNAEPVSTPSCFDGCMYDITKMSLTKVKFLAHRFLEKREAEGSQEVLRFVA